MKKFMEKIKELVSNHKLLAIIVGVALIIVIIFIAMLIWMAVASTNSYGSRLDGIEEVEIKKDKLKEVAKKLEDNEEVSKASVRIQGKIIYFDIYYVKGTSKDRAKEIANTTKEEFSDEEKSFYDLEYVLVEDKGDNKEEETFVVTGTKNSSLEEITWSRN